MRRSHPDRRVSDLARRVPAAALAAALVAGCGSGQAKPTLSGSAASVMNTHLRNVAAAAGSHDRTGATREIDAFAADVAREKAAGHLSQAGYAALETGIARTRARIGVEVVALAPTPAVAAPVAAAPSAPVPQTNVGGAGGDAKVKGNGEVKGAGKPGKGGKGKGDGGG